MAEYTASTYKLIPMWSSRSISATVSFYRTHIGANIGPLYPSNDEPNFVSVWWGKKAAANIYFTRYRPEERIPFVTNQAMVAMSENDLEPWYECARTNPALTITEDLKDMPWGYRQFTIADPDGHRLTFFKFIEHDSGASEP